MAEQEQEQNRSEEPTPYKLRRAREKGMVPRGTDLGFFAVLAALAGFLIVAGDDVATRFAQLMRRSLAAGIASAGDPHRAVEIAGADAWPALQPVLLLGGTAVLFVGLLEIMQLRGLLFSTQPLKPDFSRINPARGLKRLFSMRMLKEAFKNVVKLAAYTTVAYLFVQSVAGSPRLGANDAQGLALAMQGAGLRLLLLFLLTALCFLAIDQVIVRREYLKQMRMSRRELTREFKEREGEPRLKRRRKQLHAEFARQSKQMGSLPGSDLVIVNPQHVAVALAYDAGRMAAPQVRVKARNHWALAVKREAFRLGIPIIEDRALACRLYDECDAGEEIRESHFRAVADLYLKLRASRPGNEHAGAIPQQ